MVSSATSGFEDKSLAWPVNPGGASYIYIFDAA
jgi:hypothetical protein